MPPAPAGAHPPPHHRPAAPRDRAGHDGRVLCASCNRWQHLAPGTQLHGVDGTLQVIRQLQGSEFAAAAWETEILPRRDREVRAGVTSTSSACRAK